MTSYFSSGPQARKSFFSSNYFISSAVLSWDTSTIPDDANITSASLYFRSNTAYNNNNRALDIEWYTGSLDASAYTDGSNPTAGSVSSFAIATVYTVSLTSPSNIVKTGNTKLRFTVSGSTPTAENYIEIYMDSAYNKLTVIYSVPPTAPVVTAPNGGETWNTLQTITFNPATDSDTSQSLLKYHIQLSTNGGSSWTDIVALTSAGATSYEYDFSSITESTTSLIRIRAYDGTNYGSWDQSNAVFTIYHYRAPDAPSNINPGSASSSSPEIVGGTTPILNWTFTDPDVGDTQSQFEVVVYNTGTSAVVHDSGWVNSSSNSYTIPSDILLRNTAYHWKVRAKDNRGTESVYSPVRYIKINSLPVASITSYTDGQQINSNILNFTWNYSDADSQSQTAFQIVGSKDNWVTWAYNSGEIASSATSHTTPGLADGEWNFGVRVKDGYEWSDWSYRSNVTLPNSFEPNDTNLTAYPIFYTIQYTSIIESSTDADFYSFIASSTGIDQFTMNVPPGGNYDINVYDSVMNLVASGIKGTGLAENIIFDVTGGQTYYIKITGVNGDFSTTTNYVFQLNKHVVNYQTDYQYDSNGNLTRKTTTIVQP